MDYNTEDILGKLQHKDKFKSTTTLKFKRDIIEILSNGFEGNILEIGANTGNTTVVLAWMGKVLNKKVYSFEFVPSHIAKATERCRSFGLECDIIHKDVYKEKWDINNIGCVFIDCVHTEKCFEQDMENAVKITSWASKPILLVHDYGLQLLDGESISNVIKRNDKKYVVEKYIGENNNWNPVGTGKVIDWEGVQLKTV